jgi:hypothetical protein
VLINEAGGAIIAEGIMVAEGPNTESDGMGIADEVILTGKTFPIIVRLLNEFIARHKN